MSSQQQKTSNVYIQVIEDVINKVRDEFNVSNGGPGETVLNELQGMFTLDLVVGSKNDAKRYNLGSNREVFIPRTTSRGPSAPLNDLNVPYEVTKEYEIPSTELLFPPTPLHTPLPGTVDGSAYNTSTGGTAFTPGEYTTDNDGGSEARTGIPSQFMQPPAHWLTQTQTPLDVNDAYHENQELVNMGAFHLPTTQDFFMISSGKRKREDIPSQYHNGYIPQRDGAGDTASDELKVGEGFLSADQKSTQGPSSWIPELNGPVPDRYDDALSIPTEVVNEDYNIVTPAPNNYQGVVNEDYDMVTPAPNDLQAGTPAIVTQNDVAHDEDDEVLNENDDDDMDDVDQEEDNKKHYLVLAQFDKVSRTKNIWKCTLKDGIMHKDNSEVLFNKATGEFNF